MQASETHEIKRRNQAARHSVSQNGLSQNGYGFFGGKFVSGLPPNAFLYEKRERFVPYEEQVMVHCLIEVTRDMTLELWAMRFLCELGAALAPQWCLRSFDHNVTRNQCGLEQADNVRCTCMPKPFTHALQ